ncbi:MAG TPA: plastocyanin/azurin family copper-binding protein [Gemmatimonadaceae bacterium]|nr:plastocyanin/azurin family copper-binding protein [Gemmatimonadaceae bacterium]
MRLLYITRATAPARKIGGWPTWLVAGALLAAVAAAGACSSDGGPTDGGDNCAAASTAGGRVVTMQNFGFHPQTVRVSPGTTVTWVNCDPPGVEAHTSTADAGVWDSSFLPPGASYSQVFGQAGQFPYHCVPHPAMQGVVIVE